MATRRKTFVPQGRARTDEHAEAYVYAEFIAALLANRLEADALIEDRSSGRLVLTYDEPAVSRAAARSR